MHTNALELARQSEEVGQPERLSWGIVEFQVTDLDRTVSFWTTCLGLSVRNRGPQWAALGTQDRTLFVFHSGASLPAAADYMGMYHVAIGVPDQNEFSRMLAHLGSLAIPVSPVDHLMSKAIYFVDPDGLEIEIAYETPERFSRFGDLSRGLVLYDSKGEPHSGRSALDVEAELSYARGADLKALISDEACLAHVHFKVSDLASAVSWYEGLGFARNLVLENWGFADLGAGASYTHRIAMNTWGGPRLGPTPDNMARLTEYTLHVNDLDIVSDTSALQAMETGYTGHDPTGARISITTAC